MSLLKQIFAVDGSHDLTDSRWWDSIGWGGRKTKSGESVGPQTALALSAYYAALRAISEDIGKLPFKVYELLKPRGKNMAKAHPVYGLIHGRPNEEMSSQSFMELLTAWAIGWGNGYAEIARDGDGVPQALYPIHPSRVTPKRRDNARETLYYEVRSGEKITRVDEFEPHNLLIIHGLGDNGIQGFSVLQYAAETIGVGLAAEKFAANFFGNGQNMSGVIEVPGKLGKENLDRLRNEWGQLYGPGGAGQWKPAFLDNGMKFNRISIPPDEAQFLETRQFTIEEIARWFRIPPHKLQHLLRSTNNNIEHQAIEYVTDTLDPWITRWEREVTWKLFTEEDRGRFEAEIVVQKLLRGDHAARINFYRGMTQIGAMSPDEVRDFENLNPIDGGLGATHYIQSNMTTLDRINAGENLGKSTGTGKPDAEDRDDGKESDDAQARFQFDELEPFAVDALSRVFAKETSALARDRSGMAHDRFVAWAVGFYNVLERDLIEGLDPLRRFIIGAEGFDAAEIIEAFANGVACERANHVASARSNGAGVVPPDTAAMAAGLIQRMEDEAKKGVAA